MPAVEQIVTTGDKNFFRQTDLDSLDQRDGKMELGFLL